MVVAALEGQLSQTLGDGLGGVFVAEGVNAHAARQHPAARRELRHAQVGLLVAVGGAHDELKRHQREPVPHLRGLDLG